MDDIILKMENDSKYLMVEKLSISFLNQANEIQALENISLEIKKGEFVSVVGPSGCGKTTFLYCLAGLLEPKSGKVTFENKTITACGKDRSLVFQDPLLLPWRTVLSNISYGLEMQKQKKEEILKKSNYYVKLVHLNGFENYYPHQLSGGMRQKVNLARALANDPQILLLDEPFSHLDALTRERMQQELLNIFEKTKKTFLFVTHDIEEAIFLADKLIVLSKRPGRIKEIIKIDFPHPRYLPLKNKGQFYKTKQYVWELLSNEISNQTVSI